MLFAANGPWSFATAQCSTRIRSPKNACSTAATSPAAQMLSSDVRNRESTSIPFESASPACSASSTRGATPIPTMTASASSERPSARRTRSTDAAALERRDAGARVELDAVRLVEAGEDAADLGAEHALERHVLGKTIATSHPPERAVAATSAPIQPPPTITMRPPLLDALADRVRVGDAP